VTISLTDKMFEQFQNLILQRTGIFFGNRRRHELNRHIVATSKNQNITDIDSLFRSLLNSPTESPVWDQLISHIIVGETYFFREKILFQTLQQHILPDIISRHQRDRNIRIWSAGCSTGEEPYSLAILLDQILGKDINNWHIFILATDINKPSLKKAINGAYRQWSLRQTPPNVKSSYFHQTNDLFDIREDIKKRVMFSYLNLNTPVYPSLATCTHAMDLILWRNVAIYFTDTVIQNVLQRFYRSLLPLGYFNIGASESGHMNETPLVLKQFSGTFIYQKSTELQDMPSKTPIPFKPLSLPKPMPGTDKPIMNNVQLNVSDTLQQSEPSLSLLEQAEKHTIVQKYTEAIHAYKSHLSIYPDDAKAWYQLARVHANTGNIENAKQACENAIQHDPLIVEAYYILGLINEEDGKLDDAIADYKKTLYLQADFVLAHYHLSTVYQQMKNDNMADRHRNQAIRILSQRPSDDIIPGADELTTGQLMALLSCPFGKP
jgi:chemotaxis protein methyltransferase CheR